MSDPEIEELRDKVHCAVVLERTLPPWMLDRKESTKLSLKYRRGKGEILIVSHGGKAGGIQPATPRAMRSASSSAWSRGSTSVMSESACANSRNCRLAFRSPKGQGAAKPRTDPSPNVGPIGGPCGRAHRPGAISPGSASFRR